MNARDEVSGDNVWIYRGGFYRSGKLTNVQLFTVGNYSKGFCPRGSRHFD